MNQVRRRLDDGRLWIGIAYFGLAFVVVWLYVVNGRTVKEQAIRKATAQANYARCLAGIPVRRKINDEFKAAEIVGTVILMNTAALLATYSPGTPLYAQQVINVARLKEALSRGGVRLPVNTRASCAADRDRSLHVKGGASDTQRDTP